MCTVQLFPRSFPRAWDPPFPSLSTRNFHRPQDSHSAGINFSCRNGEDARHCNHCRRERHAASDRARLVLRQFTRVNCRAVPKACKRCGHPGVAASSENGLALRDCNQQARSGCVALRCEGAAGAESQTNRSALRGAANGLMGSTERQR